MKFPGFFQGVFSQQHFVWTRVLDLGDQYFLPYMVSHANISNSSSLFSFDKTSTYQAGKPIFQSKSLALDYINTERKPVLTPKESFMTAKMCALLKYSRRNITLSDFAVGNNGQIGIHKDAVQSSGFSSGIWTLTKWSV